MKHTKNCVYCGEPAESWTGHVVGKDGKSIIAGWCRKHDDRRRPAGFFGHFRRWMGSIRTH